MSRYGYKPTGTGMGGPSHNSLLICNHEQGCKHPTIGAWSVRGERPAFRFPVIGKDS
jgi:hypothetical protein